MDIYEILKQRAATGHCFFSLVKLKNEFGNDIVKELNVLKEQGLLRKRDGAQGVLVEIIIKDDEQEHNSDN